MVLTEYIYSKNIVEKRISNFHLMDVIVHFNNYEKPWLNQPVHIIKNVSS